MKKHKEFAEQKLQLVLEVIQPYKASKEKECHNQLYIVTDQLQDVQGVAGNTDYKYIFPLNLQMLKEAKKVSWNSVEHQCVIWDLLSMVFDEHWKALEKMVQEALDSGFLHFRLNNILISLPLLPGFIVSPGHGYIL